MEGPLQKAAATIYSLPDELVIMILKRTSYADCNSFKQTCKRYYDLLKWSHSLWRVIYRKTAGKIIYNITASQSSGDWLSDLRQYLSLRETLIDLITDMSPRHFSEIGTDITLENLSEIFAIALSNNQNYYITVSILQDFIQAAIKKVNTFQTKKPYTLTEIHYAKSVVRHLIHTFYTLKWVHDNSSGRLTPVAVLSFFTQWLDPVYMHRDEDVFDLIQAMVKDVDAILLASSDSSRLPGVETQNTCVSGVYTERQVLMTISHYMYKRRRMVLMTACNQDTLDVVKTIKSNSGHGATLGAIFQAIARGFGIKSCNLVAFPNHLYLEWRAGKGFLTEIPMQFSLDTGELRASGRCPFSANMNPNNRVNYKYSPESFVQYIVTNYLRHMGDYTGWHTDNAAHLMDFISNNRNSEYANFILFLRALNLRTLSVPFNMEYIHEEHLSTVYKLINLNKADPPRYRDLTIKHRTSSLTYCIGMICFHKEFEYLCVVRGWDLQFTSSQPVSTNETLQHGTAQPFYYVTAMDQTDRYVAQENLIKVTNPYPIYHLEDAIAREFTHFNGFFYEPNEQKQKLYPDDMAIGQMYASKSLTHLVPDKVRRY